VRKKKKTQDNRGIALLRWTPSRCSCRIVCTTICLHGWFRCM